MIQSSLDNWDKIDLWVPDRETEQLLLLKRKSKKNDTSCPTLKSSSNKHL